MIAKVGGYNNVLKKNTKILKQCLEQYECFSLYVTAHLFTLEKI